MNPRLPDLADLVDAMLRSPQAPEAAERLCRDEGASIRFSCGAYVFRMAGVGGSSTMDRQHALASWLRAARKKIAKAAR